MVRVLCLINIIQILDYKKYGSVILTNVIENSIRFNRIMQATENGLRSYYTQAVVITLVHMYT